LLDRLSIHGPSTSSMVLDDLLPWSSVLPPEAISPVPGQQAHLTCRHDGQSWRPRRSRLRADPWRAKTRIGESVGPSIAVSTMLRYALSCGA